MPGALTTAFLALRLVLGDFRYRELPFDEIPEEVASGRAVAGLLIHEGQLTFESHGLVKVLDLGEWWLLETGLPLPLGVNAARRDLGPDVLHDICEVLREAIQCALDHRAEALEYALQFGRGIDSAVADRFVAMYVNELTQDYGGEGRKAVYGATAPGRVDRGVSRARRGRLRPLASGNRCAGLSCFPACGRRSAATAVRFRTFVRTTWPRLRSRRPSSERASTRPRSTTSTLGAANQAGEDNRNVARMAALLAGLPESVAGVTLNRLCASGLSSVVSACHAVAVGDADVVVAGGVESMSRAPLVLAKPESAFPRGDRVVYDTTLGWRFPNPRLEEMFPLESMGETGENVAERFGVSREEQDAFAVQSQERWAAANAAGRFADELVPVGDVAVDEHPRPDTNAAKLASLKPAFRADGTVTAGNASGINDGAAALVIASEEKAQRARPRTSRRLRR